MLSGLDIGTSGCKITVYDKNGNFVKKIYREYDVSRNANEHEIDANVVINAVFELLKGVSGLDLQAIGITSFGESFVCLDRDDKVVFPTMLYTDSRGSDEVCELLSKHSEKKLIDITGHKPHSMYGLPKIMWLKKNKPEEFARVERILQFQDLIFYLLTGIAQIDYTLASRSLAFDVERLDWSGEILDSVSISKNLFSKAVKMGTNPQTIKAEIAEKYNLPKTLRIVNVSQDQVAACVGVGVLDVGEAIDGSGTVECITPVYPKLSDKSIMACDNYCVIPFLNNYVTYAFSFCGGALLKWYRDNFAKEYDKDQAYKLLDREVSNEDSDLMVLPYFAGAATPYMDSNATGMIANLRLDTKPIDIYKALMEAVAFEMRFNMEKLAEKGIKINVLKATGGGANSKLWLQMKADILNVPIISFGGDEAGAIGAIMVAAVAIGEFENLQAAAKVFVKEKARFEPNGYNLSKYEKYKKMYELSKELRL